MHDDQSLLAPDEPAALSGGAGRWSIVILFDLNDPRWRARAAQAEFAGHVHSEDLRRHIVWDIGAAAAAVKLAARLAAFLILQTYSRLVIDCNRPPGSAESFVRLSESCSVNSLAYGVQLFRHADQPTHPLQ